MDVCPVINVMRTGRAYMPGHFILSVDKLDTDKPIPNPHIYHSHLFSVGNFEGISKSPANFLPRRKFQKAQIILRWAGAGRDKRPDAPAGLVFLQ